MSFDFVHLQINPTITQVIVVFVVAQSESFSCDTTRGLFFYTHTSQSPEAQEQVFVCFLFVFFCFVLFVFVICLGHKTTREFPPQPTTKHPVSHTHIFGITRIQEGRTQLEPSYTKKYVYVDQTRGGWVGSGYTQRDAGGPKGPPDHVYIHRETELS